MHITLRAGEKIYVNGAVIRVDRKVSLELMNDAVFLLASHVMQVDQATTPLRQLYFIVQTLLMSPSDTASALGLFRDSLARMSAAYEDRVVLEALARTRELVSASRHFEALKELRAVFTRDDALMARQSEPLALAS